MIQQRWKEIELSQGSWIRIIWQWLEILIFSSISIFSVLHCLFCSPMCISVVRHLVQSWKNSIDTSFWPLTSNPELSEEGTLNSPAAAAKSLQLCPTLCDPTDSSPPGSPVPGILQARTLGWVAIFLLQCMKVKSESEGAQLCRLLATPWTAVHQAPPFMGFSRQEHWSGLPLPSPSTALRILWNRASLFLPGWWHVGIGVVWPPTEQIAG